MIGEQEVMMIAEQEVMMMVGVVMMIGEQEVMMIAEHEVMMMMIGELRSYYVRSQKHQPNYPLNNIKYSLNSPNRQI